MNANGDMSESSSDRNNAIENERDKLLIQPIVRRMFN
jgi:hypothetical protein